MRGRRRDRIRRGRTAAVLGLDTEDKLDLVGGIFVVHDAPVSQAQNAAWSGVITYCFCRELGSPLGSLSNKGNMPSCVSFLSSVLWCFVASLFKIDSTAGGGAALMIALVMTARLYFGSRVGSMCFDEWTVVSEATYKRHTRKRARRRSSSSCAGCGEALVPEQQ